MLEFPAGHPRSAPITTSVVSPPIGQVGGVFAHARAVETLLASYRTIPRGGTVRLAKRTSNLFRPRPAAVGPGLDVSGLTGVISIDASDPTGATADVAGMCTYENLVATTLPKGYLPYVVPQLSRCSSSMC